MTEFWRSVPLAVGVTAASALRREQEGWDGATVGDSPAMAPDALVELALAVGSTSTLKLGTSVTNPVTRHVVVLAGGLATLQQASGGRVVLGIGRGDSALAHLGLAPVRVDDFERFVVGVQALLRGEAIDHVGVEGARPVAGLGLANSAARTELSWLGALDVAKVPVEVAASGPRVMEIAARHADRVVLSLGADARRIAWAIDQMRAVPSAADRPVALGANVPVFVHEDRGVARRSIAGVVATTARFSSMQVDASGPVASSVREDLTAITRLYDMSSHGSAGSDAARALSDDTIDAFGIAGPVDYCVERLVELAELGIGKFHILRAGPGVPRERVTESMNTLVAEVIPRVRSAA